MFTDSFVFGTCRNFYMYCWDLVIPKSAEKMYLVELIYRKKKIIKAKI